MTSKATQSSSYLQTADQIVKDVIEPGAASIDKDGTFPREGLVALGKSGLLGLLSSTEVGGMGEGLRAAATVVERVGSACASTGMVLCMHYCASAVIEKHGPRAIRESIAKGEHISTLAFSEVGSRSHFWAPLSTATETPEGVLLNANKSWATSAAEADSYVWSSKPLAGEQLSTLWLVPGKAPGLSYPFRFDGMGLRGNSSGPIKAESVRVSKEAMLGADGQGFDIMMGNVLPHFQVLSAACYVGVSQAALRRTAEHVQKTRFSHIGQSLADLPTIRAYVARMSIKTDMARGLLLDTITAIETGREDAQLKVLEVKAAAGEVSTEVTETGMRVCGGSGFRKEVGVDRYFRDAHASTVMSPTTDLLNDFIGKALTGLPLF